MHRTKAAGNSKTTSPAPTILMREFETPGPITVTLELGVGDIRIVASARANTVVAVTPSDPAKQSDVTAVEQTVVDYTGGRLLIKAPKGWKQFTPWGGSESIDVKIELPTGSHVRGEAALAAMRCTGPLGECRYKTSTGDIYVEQAGPVHLRSPGGDIAVDRALHNTEVSGSGEIWIGSIDGNAVIKNSNGDTSIGTVKGDLSVKAANGDIVVNQSHSTVRAKTANGDVRVLHVVNGDVAAETAYGNVDIGILDGVTAWLELETSYGNVRNQLNAAEGPETGEGAIEVRAHTSYGDITVHRSFAADTEEEQT
jgi:hypothetical protein